MGLVGLGLGLALVGLVGLFGVVSLVGWLFGLSIRNVASWVGGVCGGVMAGWFERLGLGLALRLGCKGSLESGLGLVLVSWRVG